jgi:hypothetical protein
MSNVFSFQEAFEARGKFREFSNQIQENMKAKTKVLTDFYRRMLSPECISVVSPTTRMFFEIMLACSEFEPLKEELDKKLSILSMDMNIIREDSLSIVEGIRLQNYDGTTANPIGSLSVFGPYSEEALRALAGIEASVYFQNEPAIDPITNVIEARTIIMDYVYEHPDVDTARDSGIFSSLAYGSIGHLLERGYGVTGYAYTVDYIDGRKKPDCIVMRFEAQTETDCAKTIYLHFDYEASMLAIETTVEYLCSLD